MRPEMNHDAGLFSTAQSEALGLAYDRLVHDNPLAARVKTRVLREVLGGDTELNSVLSMAQRVPPALPIGPEHPWGAEEHLFLDILQGRDCNENSLAALRNVVGHRFKAWSHLVAFASCARVLLRGGPGW